MSESEETKWRLDAEPEEAEEKAAKLSSEEDEKKEELQQGDIVPAPDSLRLEYIKRCHIVQFINQQLLKIRTTNIRFPKILLQPDEKDRFIRILEEDKDTIHSILNDVWNDRERGNIDLRLWSGCLCAAKGCRRTSVSEHNPDGTTKRESPYTPDRRIESFEKIMITSSKDPIYEARV